MTDSFSYKQGAQLPSRIVTLSGNDLANLDAIDVDSIKFVYRVVSKPERQEIVCTISDSATMKIEVDFSALDTDTIAQYQWHVEAKQDGLLMYFPEKGFFTFSVTENI